MIKRCCHTISANTNTFRPVVAELSRSSLRDSSQVLGKRGLERCASDKSAWTSPTPTCPGHLLSSRLSHTHQLCPGCEHQKRAPLRLSARLSVVHDRKALLSDVRIRCLLLHNHKCAR